jgi:hypothetical protein
MSSLDEEDMAIIMGGIIEDPPPWLFVLYKSKGMSLESLKIFIEENLASGWSFCPIEMRLAHNVLFGPLDDLPLYVNNRHGIKEVAVYRLYHNK